MAENTEINKKPSKQLKFTEEKPFLIFCWSSLTLFFQGVHTRGWDKGSGVLQGQIGSQKCEKWQKPLKVRTVAKQLKLLEKEIIFGFMLVSLNSLFLQEWSFIYGMYSHNMKSRSTVNITR